MSDYWVLDSDHTPRAVTFEEYVEWMKLDFDQTRRVAKDKVGLVGISTVFLTVNYNWDPAGPPLLFETMIFAPSSDWHGGPDDEWGNNECWRYSTWDEAVAGHERIVAALR